MKYKNYTFLIIVFLYRFFLEINYSVIVKYIAGYEKFVYQYNEFNYIISYVFLIIFFKSMINIFKDSLTASIRGIILLNIIFLIFIPFTVMIAYSNFNVYFLGYTFLFYTFLFKLPYLKIKNVVRGITISKINLKRLYLLEIIEIILIVVILNSASKTNYRLFIKLLDVYKFRKVDLGISTLFKYILASCKLLIPILVIYYYEKRKKIRAVFYSILILLLYGLHGHKSILGLFFISIVVLFFVSQKKISKIPLLYLSLNILALLEFKLLKTFNILNFIIRRLSFLTNKIQECYFDFTVLKTPLLKMNSEISFVIGELYFNREGMRANSGLVSDAVSNYGKYGFLIYPLLFSLIISILDILLKNSSVKIKFFIGIYLSIIYISSFIKTSILTHGIFGLIILLFAFSINRDVSVKK